MWRRIIIKFESGDARVEENGIQERVIQCDGSAQHRSEVWAEGGLWANEGELDEAQHVIFLEQILY